MCSQHDTTDQSGAALPGFIFPSIFPLATVFSYGLNLL